MRRTRLKAIGIVTMLAVGAAFATAAEKVKGDATKGEAIAGNLCASCHGIGGNSEVPNFPRLAGQHAEYLLLELKDYKEGNRHSEVMAPFIATLSEEDMADVAVHYAAQAPTAGKVNEPGLLALGKQIYLEGNPKAGVPSCDGCHEENGEGTGRFPRVAGQHAVYTQEQMRLYATGKRSNGVKVMRSVAERLSDQEIRAVAEYMASLQ